MTRKLRLSAPQTNRLRSLLHMWYSPSELAAEIGVSVQWIRRRAIPGGCPHRLDDTGHIWIDGSAFVDWAKIACRRERQKLAPGHALCMACGPVEMADPITVKPISGVLEIVQGWCPKCGRRVNRSRRRNDHPG